MHERYCDERRHHNPGDIAAAARDMNEDRQREQDERMIEDAKAVLAQAADTAEAGA